MVKVDPPEMNQEQSGFGRVKKGEYMIQMMKEKEKVHAMRVTLASVLKGEGGFSFEKELRKKT